MLFLILHNSLFSQPENSPLLKKAQIQRNTQFRVNSTTGNSSVRNDVISNFQLRPEDNKAVTVLNDSVIKLRRTDIPILKDTATNSGISMLPELYYAKEAVTNNQITYRILYVDSAPLRYDFGRKLFEGGIRFLAVESDYSGGTSPVQKTLSVPEEIRVSFGSGSIPLNIKSINWPPEDVTITAPNALDSLRVKILTISNPEGYPKYIPVEPAIILSSKRESIQGFGLQTMPVAVTLKGVSSFKPVPVTVQSSLGTINNPNLVLTSSSPNEVILRSEGQGKIDLDVVNTTYLSNSISVTAIFPWLFLILAITGGLIGSIGKKLKGRGKVTLRVIVYGCILGLIVAVVYYGLGINLLNISFEDRGYNEAIVFGMGLLAGFVGIRNEA
jgi:hypothetical protein